MSNQVFLGRLAELARGRTELLIRMNVLQKTPNSGGLLFEGGALSVIQDDDDARVASLGPKKDLERVEQHMRRLLSYVQELGVADDELVRKLKEELNVAL